MKAAKQITVAFWVMNSLLGIAIVAYAATSFMGRREDPLADLRDPAVDGGGPAPVSAYSREIGPMQRVAVIENKQRTINPAPSVNLAQYIIVVSIMDSTLASFQMVADRNVQMWMGPGDDVERSLSGRVPNLDVAPTKGWRVKELLQADKKVTFTNGREEQTLLVGTAADVAGVDQSLAGFVGKAYNAGDYQTKETLSHPTRKSYLVDPNEINWALANQETVMTQDAAFAPVEGGLRMTFVRPGSILQSRGFEADDVIQRVNGLPIGSLEDIRNLKTNPQFQNARVVSVVVNRAGQQVYLTYSIPADPR